ncbi:MAG: exodeoxyribonuclease I [Spirochaetales bacterium]|nr:exodeoxyribonuclease I [Spirochaetales bacterium]
MTLLWYDLETFGRHSRYDRIAQFAAVRTDDSFRPIEEPVVLYGKQSPDYLPDPLACLITGITPQEANSKGMVEAELLRAMDAELSRPGTCALGFNTIAFDDEFVRNLYYRNFYDPYRREWASGNSRWDILDLVRAARDLRPEGMEWPLTDEGMPTVRLELLAAANHLEHDHAHDALSDVYATIAVAKMIHDKQPKLFEWAFRNRTKDRCRTMIDLADRTPLVHTSSAYFSERGNTTLVSPLVTDPNRRNIVYAFDLRHDPRALLELPAKEIRRRVFTPRAELEAEGVERIPLKGIAMNKAPFLAPRSVMGKEAEERLGIDAQAVEAHWEMLRNDHNIAGKLREVFSQEPDWGTPDDPDLQIYERFFPDEDKALLEMIRETPPQELNSLRVESKDPRIPEMLRRYIGRNYPEVLDEDGKRKWRSFCASRILFPPIPDVSDLGEFRKRLATWRDSDELEAEKKPVIKALEEYGDALERMLLTPEPEAGSHETQRT